MRVEQDVDRRWLERFASGYTLVVRVFLGIVLFAIGIYMLAAGNLLGRVLGLGVITLGAWGVAGLLRR